MATDLLLPLQGVPGESSLRRQPVPLDALLADLRQRSGCYVLTSVAHGARTEARQHTLHRLRLLGVVEQPDPRSGAAAPVAPAFIVVQSGSSATGRAHPLPVLLVIADRQDLARLSTAEQQQLRAAQRHYDLPASSRILVGTGAAAAGKGYRDDGWIEISSMSN